MSSRVRTLGLVAVVCLGVVALSGFGCRRSTSSPEQLQGSLQVWGLWQDSEDMKPVVEAFEEQTGIKVEYKKIASVATYERELVGALAEGRGPDVFVLHHTWVDSKRRLLSPAPDAVVDQRAVQDEFVDVVVRDVVRDGRVYALPTSVDTLALFYNKDIFNAARIAAPPKTWDEMHSVVEKITQVNRVGTIEQSAAALGTAANVNRAMDIVQLLMMQSGVPMVTNQGAVDITGANNAGKLALTFYTDFANKAKKVYTWDLQQDFSIDAFAEGETAMMFNYSYHVPTVIAKNPRLQLGVNFGIAPMPQITDTPNDRTIDFAAYWPFGVSISSPAPHTAWQFVRFMTNKEPAMLINTAQQTPPARKDSVLELQRDPVLGVFTEQTLTAQSWPRPDIIATDSIFNTMIDSVVRGEATIDEALTRAQDQINQALKTE